MGVKCACFNDHLDLYGSLFEMQNTLYDIRIKMYIAEREYFKDILFKV